MLEVLLRLIPHSWRATVRVDLEEEARAAGRRGVRAQVWCAVQVLRVMPPLQWTVNGDAVMSDIRYAIRSLLHARWFSVGAVLTFAIGIGVNVAVFSAVDRMLFRPLPYANADQLFLLQQFNRATGQSFGTLPASWVIEARTQVPGIEDVAVGGLGATAFTTSPEPDDAPVVLTSATFNLLTLCGVAPMRGRGFLEGDARERRKLVMLSYDAWQRRFGGRDDIFAVRLFQAKNTFEIVGILPKGFIPPGPTLPVHWDGLVLSDELMQAAGPNDRYVAPIVRLRRGESREHVEAELAPITQTWAREQPAPPAGRNATPSGMKLTELREILFSYYRPYLWLVTAGASLVLLIACTNLASLLLVRHRSREHGAAVAVALGASRRRLIRGALAEALVLSGIGSVVGIGVLAGSTKALQAVLPPVFNSYSASLDEWRVLAFSLLIAVSAALMAGLAPAIRAARVDVLSILQRTGRGRENRLRGGASLLVVEVAVGVVLVAAAALTARSLIGLSRTDVGFEADHLYTATILFPFNAQENEATRLRRYAAVLEVLRSAPGVRQAGGADVLPTIVGVRNAAFGPGFEQSGQRWQITDGFVETMGMRMLAGRSFSAVEVSSQQDVAVLSEKGVRLVWPGTSPTEAIGRLLQFPGEPTRRIVGVVSDIRGAYAAQPDPSLYLPVRPAGFRRLMFVVRLQPGSALSASDLARRIRAEIADPTIVSVGDQALGLAMSLRDEKFRATLFGTFGIIGLVLAAIGLYAVTSFEVTLRGPEMAIRASLGATTRDLRRMVLGEAIRPVVIGTLLGLGASYWLARFIQAFLHDVNARDPSTMVVVAMTLVITAVIAAWFPARRGARADPAAVLRSQ